jgi:protein-S-isoprenylcysteine O-methyltransferase Ste14
LTARPDRGPWTLQRLRVPLGFVVGGLYLWLARPQPRLLAAGALVALAGVAMRAWAAGHIVKNDRLATTGPYAHTRNPLYFGSFLLAAGCALAVHWGLLAVVAGFWLFVYTPVIRRERDFVRARYPEPYAEWERHVPASCPESARGGAGRATPAGAVRSQALPLHREWQAALGFVAVMAWLAFWTWRRQVGA